MYMMERQLLGLSAVCCLFGCLPVLQDIIHGLVIDGDWMPLKEMSTCQPAMQDLSVVWQAWSQGG